MASITKVVFRRGKNLYYGDPESGKPKTLCRHEHDVLTFHKGQVVEREFAGVVLWGIPMVLEPYARNCQIDFVSNRTRYCNSDGRASIKSLDYYWIAKSSCNTYKNPRKKKLKPSLKQSYSRQSPTYNGTMHLRGTVNSTYIPIPREAIGINWAAIGRTVIGDR